MSYYKVIKDIWKLDYTMFRIPVFRCKWVENNNDIKIDGLGFILMDLNKEVTKRLIRISITVKTSILHHRSY